MSDDFPTIVHVVQSAGEILGDWIGEAYSEPQLTEIECRYVRADCIEALEAENKALRETLAGAEAMLEREIQRVQKIRQDLPPPHKVDLFYVQQEYRLMLSELKGEKQ